jgi:S1-C subfamily serine protease
MWVAFYQPSTVIKNEKLPSETIPETIYPQLTPQQQCQNEGNVWCNGKCYTPCPSGQRFNCPPTGEPTCIITRSIEDIKKSIVYIRHDVTGCCDSYGQISSRLGNAGSGIIYYKDNQTNTIYVLTSRHVVDCVFTGSCLYPSSEKITIRTQDGNLYAPTKILHAPSNLDLAILQFKSANDSIVPALIFNGNITVGEKITAIGYPAVGLKSPELILKFSITEGKITNIYDLLTYQGMAFRGIESDAITGRGASGGGLFNEDGQLIGIITWGDREQRITIAIDIKVFDAIKYFEGCPSGYYSLVEGGCCPYGTIGGTDGKCYEPCGRPNEYCPPPSTCCNNECYFPCPSGYVLGSDCVCHQECAKGHYCSEGFTCCNEQCISCPPGSFLGTDCKCYSWV